MCVCAKRDERGKVHTILLYSIRRDDDDDDGRDDGDNDNNTLVIITHFITKIPRSQVHINFEMWLLSC